MNNIEFSNFNLLDDSLLNERSSNCCGADGYISSYKRNRFSPSRTVKEKAIEKGLMESESNFTNESLLDGLSDVSLLNADGESIYSNAISPEQVDAAAKAATAAAMIIQQRRAAKAESEKSAIKASCGRKPLIGKAKKAKYEKCVSDFLKRKQDAEKAQAQSQATTFPPVDYSRLAAPQEDDKILGMPKGLAIGLGLAVLALGGFVAFKMIKKARG